ncbi:uncharacterized membrane protein YgaE (UPF0421/DUF939 family) [Enterococcus sp. PF1-24]|uniref:FUSC family protein n=1 Tax=unclassified Enterococcus TaxID=2608891 RepID=UPI002474CE85|nr:MULTISPECIES: aromatic acid exporter family protein [unclassified Enterococcus]MDH6365188.1 uncharacterized membrane protein YgaE (UPF0421/DUF939 family) [Enterococcus sp. PFB1-1]MDH6402289.1 uncharacterized membrane protein YgaE (UPF0421/DUF939 family) [Enterococcus sp. PF1-24]
MEWKKFRIGLRTTKSAIAVMLCILIFHFTTGEKPMIAAVAAIFALRQDLNTSVSFGKSRIIGNSLGGGLALFYFFVKAYFPDEFLAEVILVPLLVALCIAISNGIDNNTGIVSAISTLLLITLNIPEGESLLYILSRVFETFVGTFIAIALNFFTSPKPKEQKAEITEDLAVLAAKQDSLRKQLLAVQEQISQQKKK